MKTFAFLVVLSLAAVTVQSPANATASASVSVSDYTCSHFAADGTLLSTSTQPSSFSVTYTAPPGAPAYWDPAISFGVAGCFAFLSWGEHLDMSAHVTLGVSDQGLAGTLGGEYNRVPYRAGGVGHVPAGFELAFAAAGINDFIDPRDPNHPNFFGGGVGLSLLTNQDGLADSFLLSGVVQGTAIPISQDRPLPVFARLLLQTNAWAVSGVPEPETYAMLMAGLGLLGFMARRRVLAKED